MAQNGSDLTALSATEAAARIAAGELTSVELVTALLEQIGEREPAVEAWQYIDPEEVRAAAALRDKQAARGPLHGVPVGLKDMIDTAAMPTTYGSPIYSDHRPNTDAACVARLIDAGAVIMGKAVTTQFAHRTAGKTRNPHNPEHTPGGSSSGSAAAVAAKMVPLALGTQTGGSVIRPATYCGVVGYKPAHGAFDFAGTKQLAPSLDTLGFFTRNLDDVPTAYSVLAGQTFPERQGGTATPRITLVRGLPWPRAEAAAQKLVEDSFATFATAGARVRETELPKHFDDLFDAHTILMAYEASRALAFEREKHWALVSKPTQDLILKGESYGEKEVADAYRLAETCRAELPKLFDADEVILTLPAFGEAPKGLDWTGDPECNRLWTTLHVPCLTIPAGTGPQGLPLGLQFVARIGSEAEHLAAVDWAARKLDLPVVGDAAARAAIA